MNRKEYMKAWKEAHRDQERAKLKAWHEAHKEQHKAQIKAWHEAHREEQKAYRKANKDKFNEYYKAYNKADLNSLGQTKQSIRKKSRLYLNKYGQKIEGYQIHHCCTYAEPYKFIYCSKEMHRLIHSYLRQHNIDADSNHYQYIKHLLDDTVIKYNLD